MLHMWKQAGVKQTRGLLVKAVVKGILSLTTEKQPRVIEDCEMYKFLDACFPRLRAQSAKSNMRESTWLHGDSVCASRKPNSIGHISRVKHYMFDSMAQKTARHALRFEDEHMAARIHTACSYRKGVQQPVWFHF